MTAHYEDLGPWGAERDIAKLDAIERAVWEADLDLRRQAEEDPALAEIVAAADDEYARKYGKPWRNPLTREEN
jgi:hypothetical protein